MPQLLLIKDLRFSWAASRPLLDIEHLSLNAGERLFLRGPSGSGKSTLLGLIGGVLRPQHGSIKILSSPLEALSGAARDRFRADHIGFIFQQFNLLPYLDALDNVLLPLRFSARRRSRVKAQGAQRHACGLLSRLELDPAALRGRPAAELSVGQQQRVAAARALIGGPELIVADEPTSALDSDTRASFLALLFEECQRAGSSLLFVSHDRSLEARFDRAIDLSTFNRAVSAPTC